MPDKLKVDYKLVGLSRPNSFTLELLYTDKETFWAKSNFAQDRFDALFAYCKNNWSDLKIAEVECDSIRDDGTPVGAIVVGVREWDLPILEKVDHKKLVL